MDNEHKQLWNAFIKSFETNIKAFNNENNLLNRLTNRSEITKFYKQDLFPKIAEELGLKQLDKEYLRVDITLIENNKGFEVPCIVVESENDSIGDLDNECRKLLTINAPLKILLTRLDSLEEIVKRPAYHEDQNWYYALKEFIKYDRLDGIFAVISYEKSSMKFSHICYDCHDKNLRVGELQSFQLD